jgi:monoterpene epsilon-lactone hydrolase
VYTDDLQEVMMTVSPETARVEALYQNMFDASDGSIESLRAAYSAMFAGFTVPADAVTDHFEADGVPCTAVSAPGTRSDRALMLVHGGGTCLGSADDYGEFSYRLSKAADCRVVVPDYRLAPEHPFPAALDDCVTVYRWILNQDHVHGVAVLGESAGGGIALSVTVRVRDEGVRQPDALVLVSPLTDLAGEGASMTERAHLDPLPIAIMIKRMGGAYLAGREPKSTPLASPAYADLNDLPPLLVLVGEREGLYDDAARVAEKVRAAGGDVELEVGEGQLHIFPVFDFLPEARAATDRIGSFVAARFSPGPRQALP